MRFDTNFSPAKMKPKKIGDDSSVEELEQKLNNFSLDAGKCTEQNNFETNDLDGSKKDEAVVSAKEKKVVVKKEPATDDQVDEAVDALNDLSIEPKSEDKPAENDRTPRAPERHVLRTANRNTTFPFVNRQLTVGGTVEVVAPAIDDPLNSIPDDKYLEMTSFLASAPYNNSAQEFLKYMTELIGVDEGFEQESTGSEGQSSISGSPPQSSTYVYSPGVAVSSPFSNSSGYASCSSSPSHSPPRTDDNYIPEPIQKINICKGNSRERDILPKLDISLPIQSQFFNYILSYNSDESGNSAINSTTQKIYWKNDLKNLIKPLQDGDTMLMIFIANPKSTREIAEKLKFNTQQETVFRLFSIFHLVERFHKDYPQALEAQNKLQQSVLHLAASNCFDHPLVAAYIAEKLAAQGYNFNQRCTASYCTMKDSGNLLHCIAQNGDSHAEVLNNLLQVQKLRELKDSPCYHNAFLMHTPLHVAIKAQNLDMTGTLRSLKTVKTLIKHDVILTKRVFSQLRHSALHIALQGKPNYDLVDLILSQSNSEVNVLDSGNNHPLMILAKSSSQLQDEETFKILNLLLEKGATLKKVPSDGLQELTKDFNKNVQTTVFRLDIAAALNIELLA